MLPVPEAKTLIGAITTEAAFLVQTLSQLLVMG